MTSPELLHARDRCQRIPFWAKSWEWPKLAPSDILRRAVELGLTSEAEDPGYEAGSEVMTLAADRGFETAQTDLYALAEHFGSLSDLLTTVLRGTGGPWARPEDLDLGNGVKWQSSAFLEPSGVRLKRVVLASRWSAERKLIESHSFFSLFEVCCYQMPMTMTICVLGSSRDGKHVGPWTRAYQHPLNRGLRFRKRSGESFGSAWKQAWREELDTSREAWLEAMAKDGVLDESCFEVEVKVPIPEVQAKVRGLAVRRLREIQEQKVTPAPSPSQCWMPSRCQFSDACWLFTEPNPRLGYVKIA